MGDVLTGDGTGEIARRKGLLGRKGAVAVSQQYRYVARINIGGRQIGKPVAVEVARRDGIGVNAGREGLLGREGAVPVTQQHQHVIGQTVVRRREVGHSVDVEVAGRDGLVAISCGEGLAGRKKRPSALAGGAGGKHWR